MMQQLILGSSSKWRAQVLSGAGYEFTQMNPEIDEKAVKGRSPDPSGTALAVALAKADALAAAVASKDALVICSDQVVSHNGTVREKPSTSAQAREYLLSYSTTVPAETHTAVVVFSSRSGKRVHGVDVARQYFKPVPVDLANRLIAKGDIMHCAGGFMIDDGIYIFSTFSDDKDLLLPFLDKREGDEDSIIGMPLKLLARLIKQVQEE